jgi:hypothetical protein
MEAYVSIQVKIVRMLLKQYGRFPNDVWRPDIISIGEVEVEGETTAGDIISFAKEHFPAIPRHEFALVGWPEKEWDDELSS